MTKQELIQEAWGVHYNTHIDDNGFISYSEFEKNLLYQWGDSYFEKSFNPITKKYTVRPKALKGIDNNNGWSRVEDSLPAPEETVVWLRNEGEPPVIASELDVDFYGVDYFTHWRPLDFKQPHY